MKTGKNFCGTEVLDLYSEQNFTEFGVECEMAVNQTAVVVVAKCFIVLLFLTFVLWKTAILLHHVCCVCLQTCPLLLRVFTTNNGRHHRIDEFARGNVPSSELQIYTW